MSCKTVSGRPALRYVCVRCSAMIMDMDSKISGAEGVR
jgi:DNA-directed RNA polymerase subunit RPC12/RpoP